MKRFLKLAALFVLPIVAIIVVYIATDVFKVIRHYDSYYGEYYPVGINRSYGSTMTYVNQNPKYDYDSFIFGNSRSLYYEIDTWKQYLPKGSRCMHFDESGGSITGIYDKVAYIDKTNGKLNNALLVIDYQLLSNLDQEGYLFVSPPAPYGHSSYADFHSQHLGAFLDLKFLISLVDYSLFGIYRPYMGNYIAKKSSTYISEYNEIQSTLYEKQIAEGTYYDVARIAVFKDVQKPGSYSDNNLNEQGVEYLQEVKRIFDKHNTSYKIVISPLYDQVKLNPETYTMLCGIFGEENIYDFSGVNKWNADYHNYYEASHYRPHVAEEIMCMVYSIPSVL